MENASKALLIAGEVFVGIIVLSMFVYAFQKIYTFAESYQNRAERQKIIAFNTQYTKYITNTGTEITYIYSEDVVTLTEQVTNWNKTTAIDSEKIELNIYAKNNSIIYSTENRNNEFNRKTFLVDYKLNGDPNQNNKEYKFSCKVEENSDSGRVKKITVQIQGVRD